MAGPYKTSSKEKAQAVWRLFAGRSNARKQRVLAFIEKEVEESKKDLAEYRSALLAAGISNEKQASEVGVRWTPKTEVFSLAGYNFWRFD